MPRFTPCRILGWVVLLTLFAIFLSIGTWVALPSPVNVSEEGDNGYHLEVLRSGRVLSTVHRNRLYSGDGSFANEADREAFALEWQLSHENGDDILLIRDRSLDRLPSGYEDKRQDYATNTGLPSYYEVNLQDYASIEGPWLANSSHRIHVQDGDPDGIVLPWFTYADSILLSWAADRYYHLQPVDLILYIPEKGVLEIRAHLPFGGDGEYPKEETDGNSFIQVTNIRPRNMYTGTPDFGVSGMSIDVPSKTYAVRLFMVLKLKELALNIFDNLTVISSNRVFVEVMNFFGKALFYLLVLITLAFEAAAVYSAVVFLCWLRAGRPDFSGWSRRSHLTNWLTKRYWSGRRLSQVSESELDFPDDAQDPDDGPRPLADPLAFFRSRAPLDDLLVTFTATAWMVQPVRRRRINLDDTLEPDNTLPMYEKPQVDHVGN